MRSTSRLGPRPRAVLAILVWAVAVGAGLVAAAVAVVVHELRPVRSWADNFAARGVLAVGELLCAVALLLVLGSIALWRTGRRGMVSTGFAMLVVAGVWGIVDGLVERSSGSALVGVAVLVVGALPLAALRTARARTWVAGAPKPARTNASSPWADRLTPTAMRYLAGVWLTRLTAYLFAVLLLSSIGFAAIDGPTAGRTMATVAGAGIAGSLVGWFLSLRATRNAVADAHDLPRGACRYVLFTDPAAFDATLTGVLRAAGRLPRAEPAATAE